MTLTPYIARTLAREARSLRTRLDRVRPLATVMPMVGAAAVSARAEGSVAHFLTVGRRRLRLRVRHFLDWLDGARGKASAAQAQRQFSLLKLELNVVLTQFDIFADVFTQRSEHGYGVWLAGLDVAAADGLRVNGLRLNGLSSSGRRLPVPPVVVYLDRGLGAAIRRARTRLPGGASNPVAIIRVPRERMVGAGVASSLLHEVGHQGAALLGLVESLRQDLEGLRRQPGADGEVWAVWQRWISEIVADFWSLARIGVGSTVGLMGVVSLPRAFVFRIQLDAPHPFPWIRVKLSCAIGRALYPDPQWRRLDRLWEQLYPLPGLNEHRQWIARLEATMPALVSRLLRHRSPRLGERSLGASLADPGRTPRRLRRAFRRTQDDPSELLRLSPTLALATLGQARFDGTLSPEAEARWMHRLLDSWALRRRIQESARLGAKPVAPSAFEPAPFRPTPLRPALSEPVSLGEPSIDCC